MSWSILFSFCTCINPPKCRWRYVPRIVFLDLVGSKAAGGLVYCGKMVYYILYIYCTYICIHTIHVIVIYVDIYIYTDMFAAANRASIAFFGLEHLAYKKLAQHFLSARLTCWITRPSVGPAVSGVVDKAGGSWKSIRWCQTDESFVGAISRVSRVSPRMIILLVWELISSWREHFQLHPEKCSKLEKHIFFLSWDS